MGAPYGSQRQLWWDGPTYSADPATWQDDLAVIASSANRFGYRTDEAPGSLFQAKPLELVDGSYSAAGVITRTSDRDAYSFSVTEESRVTIRGDVADNGSAMLDVKLEVYAADGTLLSRRDTVGMAEIASLALEPGEYRVVVASHGGDGDVGQYRLRVDLLPVAWQRTLVGAGNSSAAGASFQGGVLRVDGTGRDIGGVADGFQFVHQPLAGDGRIEAQLVRLNESHTTLRAGLMIRSGTASNEPFVALLYVPNQGVRMVWRQTAGASAEVGETTPATAPVWLRLVREGDTFVGAFSADGQTWTEAGRPQVGLGAQARIGFAAAARGTADARVFFENVRLSQGAAAGDINGDTLVDLVDFGILKDHFGSRAADLGQGDLSGDGQVDLSDFGILKANFSPAVLAQLAADSPPRLDEAFRSLGRPLAAGSTAATLRAAAVALAMEQLADEVLG
jgi:hypothetical protein